MKILPTNPAEKRVDYPRLAELGRSEHEIMAITGHSTSKEVIQDTRAASQKRRAERAMDGFEFEAEPTKSVPPSRSIQKGGTESRLKPLLNKDFVGKHGARGQTWRPSTRSPLKH